MRRILYLLFLLILTQIFIAVMIHAESNTTAKPIYIVPDNATFLFYLSKWSADEKYPIFIGKSKYLEKFASVYNNGNNKLIEIETPQKLKVNKTLAYKAILSSFNDQDLISINSEGNKWELKRYYNENNIKPKGIVLTNLNSKEFIAGVALTAFHRQMLEFYEPPVKPILGNYTRDAKETIRKEIILILNEWGMPYKGIGEGVDTITIAMDIPYKYDDNFSLDDAINRETADSLTPYAFTGRLMDLDKGLALYQAMCSMFLKTSKALFFDRWPREWMRSLEVGAWDLRKEIPCVSIYDDLNKWRDAVGKYNVYDLVFVNAAGNPDQWSGGTLDDIPDSVPVAVNFSHSSSAADPTDYNTIAGRWLQNGAFVYYGSVSEPYSIAFNLSQDVLDSWCSGKPFSQALEQKEKLPPQAAKPWKLIYIGDPLFYARFEVKEEDESFYKAVKNSLLSLEDLSFTNAEDYLENYLDKERSEKDNMIFINQAKNLLTEIYMLSFVDKIFGVSVFKYYNKDFFRAWMSKYKSAQNVYVKAVEDEEKLFQLFNKKYEFKKGRLKPGTHLNDLWNANRMKLKNNLTFVPVWKILGPVDSDFNKNNMELIETITDCYSAESVFINGKPYNWKLVKKDPVSNNLDIKANKKNDNQSYFGLFTINADEDTKAVLRFISACSAKIYLDKQLLLDYGKDRVNDCVYHPFDIKKGEHVFVVELDTGKKTHVSVGLRISDDNFSRVDGIVFTLKR